MRTEEEKQNYNKLVNKLLVHRQETPEGLWWFGLPNIDQITLSLRGQLREKNNDFVWIADPPEFASCCKGLTGEEAKEHCKTAEHINTMLDENYTDEQIKQQLDWLTQIILISLDLPED